jgi:hypothetical protein
LNILKLTSGFVEIRIALPVWTLAKLWRYFRRLVESKTPGLTLPAFASTSSRPSVGYSLELAGGYAMLAQFRLVMLQLRIGG